MIKTKPKALVYSPYLNILGGGEQYLVSFIKCLLDRYEVFLVWKDPGILKSLEDRFQLPADKVNLIPYFPARLTQRRFQLILFVSDGSVPLLPFRNSMVLFMSPFTKVKGSRWWTKFKLKFINQIICFSKYTQQFIDTEFGVNSHLIYPAINVTSTSLSKQNLILSVGRFTTTMHHKRQDALIKAFIDIENQLPGWRLILSGGTEPGSQKFLTSLRRSIKHHCIDIRTDISSQALSQLYGQAKIYWHAAGFGADLTKSPQKAEHFGISVVEAMGNRAVPLVFNAGGPKEIVTEKSGITWNNLRELENSTLKLAKSPKQLTKLAAAAFERAKHFTTEKFCQKVYDLLEE